MFTFNFLLARPRASDSARRHLYALRRSFVASRSIHSASHSSSFSTPPFRLFRDLSFFVLPELNQTQSIVLGLLLLFLGSSFAWKGYNALINGRMLIWTGFLPFTLLSPFVYHLHGAKNSLLQYKEGLWIHLLMGPAFIVLAVLCFCAGADYAGLPGTKLLNTALTGGGKTTIVSFDPRRGYSFHMSDQASHVVDKAVKTTIELDANHRLYDTPNQKLEDVTK